MGAAPLGPQARRQPAARRGVLEEGVVLERQVAELQIRLAGTGLDRHQLRIRDLEDESVEIGQLLPAPVDPVVVGIALRDEALRRRRRRGTPRLQRRHVGIVHLLLPVLAQEDLDPIARLRVLDQRGELGRIRVPLVELL